ncbi:MAG: FAD-dependent oxidoreductase [Cyanobacteriota bacterium]|nr:FAD-dependent oxidoreductase [Cyanobacteriota bacterium]
MVRPVSDPVLVLGGGLMGLAMAHALAVRGASVLVLSRRRGEAAGFVAAGMLAPHAEGLSGELLALGQASLALIPAWVERIEADSGLACGLRDTGIVVPFRTESERDAYPTARFGEALDRSRLEQEVAGLAPPWRAGLLFRQDGQIDNRRCLMRALESACVQRGVAFEEGSEVVELLSDGRSQPSLLGVRVRGANGEVRLIHCCRAVLTCGAWSRSLLPDVPIFPAKGQMMSLQGPRQALRRILFGPGTYLVPRDDGLVVVGATSEPEAGFQPGLTPSGQRQLGHGVASLLPEMGGWPVMERWWGFRPCTPDGGPLLGESPIEGLWLAVGHQRNGVLLAAVTGEIVSAGLMQQQMDLEEAKWLGRFSADRFGPIVEGSSKR